MEQSQYNQLFSFIWNIATDVLVYAFDKGEYKKIIMPMIVLRRIDVLLEPTKQTLLAQKKMLDDNKITNQDPILFNITGYPFYNTSLFTMKTLKSETDPLRLKMNFTDYLNGFSKDVQDIIDKFHLRQMVDNLTETERLGSIIEKFTDDKINLSNKPVLDDEGNVRLPALDNHTMGTMFEELLRRFNLLILRLFPLLIRLKIIPIPSTMALAVLEVFLPLHRNALKRLLLKEEKMCKC